MHFHKKNNGNLVAYLVQNQNIVSQNQVIQNNQPLQIPQIPIINRLSQNYSLQMLLEQLSQTLPSHNNQLALPIPQTILNFHSDQLLNRDSTSTVVMNDNITGERHCDSEMKINIKRAIDLISDFYGENVPVLVFIAHCR